jgi:signal transduction histidine kinase
MSDVIREAPANRANQAVEREQTDESLRAEREKVDTALADGLSAIEETADAVIARARRRADAVLATVRAETDRQVRTGEAALVLARQRQGEDATLKNERATADGLVREERAEQIELLASERNETDKDLRAERSRADVALATRDDVLAMVSHDLRGMLATIMGYAALIEKAPPGDEVIAYARRIGRSGGRMGRLVGDLVDIASIEAGALAVTREAADLTPVIAEALDSLHGRATAAGVSLVNEATAPLTFAFDSARVLQVLINLLSNAVKFTEPGGVVTVGVQPFGGDVCVSVTDTGIGIPADKLDAVFARFLQVATNDRRGVGLGLYISKSIVLGHGGRIWAENRAGGGTTFKFTLPARAADRDDSERGATVAHKRVTDMPV